MGCIENLLLATVLLEMCSYPVTGTTMAVTPSSNTLVEGQSLRIFCSENSSTGNVIGIELHRNNGRMFHVYIVNQLFWDTSYTGPNYRTRAVVTGSVTLSAASLEFFINNTICADSAVFRCIPIYIAGRPTSSTPQNITVHGVTDYPVMSGGRVCNTTDDPDCDKCTPVDPFAPKSKYIKKGEMLELVCDGQVGLPKTSNRYRWYKETERDFFRREITDYITTVISDPTDNCSTTGRSTLRYYHTEFDAGLVLTCEVTYDNRHIAGGGVMTRGANTSVCIEGFFADKSTPQPGTEESNWLGTDVAVAVSVAVIVVVAIICATIIIVCILRRKTARTKAGDQVVMDEVNRTSKPLGDLPIGRATGKYLPEDDTMSVATPGCEGDAGDRVHAFISEGALISSDRIDMCTTGQTGVSHQDDVLSERTQYELVPEISQYETLDHLPTADGPFSQLNLQPVYLTPKDM